MEVLEALTILATCDTRTLALSLAPSGSFAFEQRPEVFNETGGIGVEACSSTSGEISHGLCMLLVADIYPCHINSRDVLAVPVDGRCDGME